MDILFAGAKCNRCGKPFAECQRTTCPAERKAEKEAERDAYAEAFTRELDGLQGDTGRRFRDDVALLRHVRKIVRAHVKATKKSTK